MAYYSQTTSEDGVRVTIDFIQWLRDQRGSVSGADPDGFGPLPSPRSVYDGSVDAIASALSAANVPTKVTLGPFALPLPAGGGTGSAPAPTLSAEDVLKQIVEGINAAESRLNLQNFVIASGNVEAKLNLPVAGVTISFSITPKPYS